jgi:hypothetical protein
MPIEELLAGNSQESFRFRAGVSHPNFIYWHTRCWESRQNAGLGVIRLIQLAKQMN